MDEYKYHPIDPIRHFLWGAAFGSWLMYFVVLFYYFKGKLVLV